MQNLYESPPLPVRVKPSPDILVICRTFLPEVGGIQEYAYNRCLQDPERIIVLAAACPGDAEFDLAQPFTIYRWFNPPLLQKMGVLGSLLKQVLAMVCSCAIALQLYRRYHYRAIEWSHAYDFPALLLLSYLCRFGLFLSTCMAMIYSVPSSSLWCDRSLFGPWGGCRG